MLLTHTNRYTYTHKRALGVLSIPTESAAVLMKVHKGGYVNKTNEKPAAGRRGEEREALGDRLFVKGAAPLTSPQSCLLT